MGTAHQRALRALPRCYPGTRKVVGATGFEPATPCAQDKCTWNFLVSVAHQ